MKISKPGVKTPRPQDPVARKNHAVPDPGEKAPRPRHVSDEDGDIPGIDRPPKAFPERTTSFDKGMIAQNEQARTGTLPGSDDLASNEPALPNPSQAPVKDVIANQPVNMSSEPEPGEGRSDDQDALRREVVRKKTTE